MVGSLSQGYRASRKWQESKLPVRENMEWVRICLGGSVQKVWTGFRSDMSHPGFHTCPTRLAEKRFGIGHDREGFFCTCDLPLAHAIQDPSTVPQLILPKSQIHQPQTRRTRRNLRQEKKHSKSASKTNDMERVMQAMWVKLYQAPSG